MGEIIEFLTTTPLGLAAVVGGLVVIFILVAVMSERKTRKLYPDRDRRGTKAVAKAKKKKTAEKNAANAGATATKKSTSTPAASKPKKQLADKVEETDIGDAIEGFFDKLWGDEETGEKGLLEKLWDSDDDDEEEEEEEEPPKTKKAKAKPEKETEEG
jgi:cell division protein FtsN